MNNKPSQVNRIGIPSKEEIRDRNMIAHLVSFVEHEANRDPKEAAESNDRYLNCHQFYTLMKKEIVEQALAEQRENHQSSLEALIAKIHETVELYGKNAFTIDAEIVRHIISLVRESITEETP